MHAVLSVLHVFTAVVMVLLILLHSGKDTGLSGMGGVGTGGSSPFGSGGAMLEKNLTRWTVGFAVAFFVLTALLIKV